MVGVFFFSYLLDILSAITDQIQEHNLYTTAQTI